MKALKTKLNVGVRIGLSEAATAHGIEMYVSVRTGLTEAGTAHGEVGIRPEPLEQQEGYPIEFREAIITLTLPVNDGVCNEGGEIATLARVLVSFTKDWAGEFVTLLEELVRKATEATVTLMLPVNRGIWNGGGDLTTLAQVTMNIGRDEALELVNDLQELIREAARKNAELRVEDDRKKVQSRG